MNAAQVPALLIAVPLGFAALLAGIGRVVPRFVTDGVAVVGASGCTVGAAWLCLHLHGGRLVSWVGGWGPSGTPRRPVGIALVADPGATALLVLTGVLVVAGLIYSWGRLEEEHGTYHAVTMVFFAGAAGFLLTGDLFDTFVWFEVIGASGYALVGMRVEEPSSLHAAIGFGIVNSLGASFALVGLTLLYARTGQLNLALIGQALHQRPADPLVGFAFAALLVGVLTKAAIAPFHFWTADAEALAPTPVCALLSGSMIAIGLYAVARWWWVVFDGVLPHLVVQHLLLGAGAITAVVGAVMAVSQWHLKRMLAYSTISHSGVALLGIAVLGRDGLAAAGAYLIGHALIKGPLFLASGVLLNRYDSVDERLLGGRGRWATGLLVLCGGLGLAGLPPLGLFWGKALLEHSLEDAGLTWAVPVVIGAGALTGGAVLRVGARLLFGWGGTPEDRGAEPCAEIEEPEGDGRGTTWGMLWPAVALLAGGVATTLTPALRRATDQAAGMMVDRAGYTAATLLHHTTPVSGTLTPVWETSTLLLTAVGVAGALVVAALGLWFGSLRRVGTRLVTPLGGLHFSDVTEQCVWLLAGAAVLAAVLGM